LIIQISHSEHGWQYPYDEWLGEMNVGGGCFIEFLGFKGGMFMIHVVDNNSVSFYLINNEREAIEMFLEEARSLHEVLGVDLEDCSVSNTLANTLKRYDQFKNKSRKLGYFMERLLTRAYVYEESTSSYEVEEKPHPFIEQFELNRELLISYLHTHSIHEKILERTRELLENYLPYCKATSPWAVIGASLYLASVESKQNLDAEEIVERLHTNFRSLAAHCREMVDTLKLPSHLLRNIA